MSLAIRTSVPRSSPSPSPSLSSGAPSLLAVVPPRLRSPQEHQVSSPQRTTPAGRRPLSLQCYAGDLQSGRVGSVRVLPSLHTGRVVVARDETFSSSAKVCTRFFILQHVSRISSSSSTSQTPLRFGEISIDDADR